MFAAKLMFTAKTSRSRYIFEASKAGVSDGLNLHVLMAKVYLFKMETDMIKGTQSYYQKLVTKWSLFA